MIKKCVTQRNWPFPIKRAMANNSAIFREKNHPQQTFLIEWGALAKSGTGERGIFNLSSAQAKAPHVVTLHSYRVLILVEK